MSIRHAAKSKAVSASVTLLIPLVGLLGCASTRPAHVFEPDVQPGTRVLYVDGTPVAAVTTDCCFVAASVQFVPVGSHTYARVYLLYANGSPDTVLLGPQTALKLGASKGRSTFPPLSPLGPSQLLTRLENEKNGALFAQAFLGAIEAATVGPTSVTGPDSRQWQIDDVAEKRSTSIIRTAEQMEVTDIQSELLQDAINSDLLRRNTVLPGRRVAGYVYFPLPFANDEPGLYEQTRHSEKEIASYDYQLAVEMACDTVRVNFRPVEGE